MNKAPEPIKEHEEVASNSDNKIDQDFKGFPHGTAAEKIINPSSSEERKVAAVNIKDGEKVNGNTSKMINFSSKYEDLSEYLMSRLEALYWSEIHRGNVVDSNTIVLME